MLAATKIIEDLRRENADLKAKIAGSEAALHRFQHGQQIEGDYVCEAAEKERAARLKAEAEAAVSRKAAVGLVALLDSHGWGEGPALRYARSALSTDAGQPILDYIAAARRLNDGVKLFIKVMNGARMAELDKCPTFDQLVRDVDAAEAKLGGKQ